MKEPSQSVGIKQCMLKSEELPKVYMKSNNERSTVFDPIDC